MFDWQKIKLWVLISYLYQIDWHQCISESRSRVPEALDVSKCIKISAPGFWISVLKFPVHELWFLSLDNCVHSNKLKRKEVVPSILGATFPFLGESARLRWVAVHTQSSPLRARGGGGGEAEKARETHVFDSCRRQYLYLTYHLQRQYLYLSPIGEEKCKTEQSEDTRTEAQHSLPSEPFPITITSHFSFQNVSRILWKGKLC